MRLIVAYVSAVMVVFGFAVLPALGGSFASDTPRDLHGGDRGVAESEFLVVGGTDRGGLNRRTIAFEPITTLHINTDSARMVDARRLLQARPARGIVRPEQAVTVIQPAEAKPGMKAFLRASRVRTQSDAGDASGVVGTAGENATARRPQDAEAHASSPGWGRMRVRRPDGEDVVYEVRGTAREAPAVEDRADARRHFRGDRVVPTARSPRSLQAPPSIRGPYDQSLHPPRTLQKPLRDRVSVPLMRTKGHALHRYLRALSLRHGLPPGVFPPPAY